MVTIVDADQGGIFVVSIGHSGSELERTMPAVPSAVVAGGAAGKRIKAD
ncbi:hypothetical protein CupriaWKF_00195 [Cupriavidus sp. WKF15]|nr:hypothetical protein [Cupriavidus sp. WKF15]WER46049.1 hypothetical protein CupriaWKF_00195 [Cupriavidus sp. WKF15]